jgi:hypothetical protein
VSPDEFTVSAQRPLTDLFGLSRVSMGALPVRNVLGHPVLDGARESRPTLRALLMTRMYIATGATAASRAEQAPALSSLADHIAVSAAIRPRS